MGSAQRVMQTLHVKRARFLYGYLGFSMLLLIVFSHDRLSQ